MGQGRAIPLLVKTRVEVHCSVCQAEERGAFWTKKREDLILIDYLQVTLNSHSIYK